MKNEISHKGRAFWFTRIVFSVCFITSLGLVVIGFFMPPQGVIDGSVLAAVGELILFPTLLYGYRAIELGMRIHFQRGETSISIEKDDDGNENQ